MPQPPASRRATAYDARRDRRRIQWAILSLALVLIAMAEARKPANWTWLAPHQTGQDSRGGATRQTSPGVAGDPLEPDQFRLELPPQIPQNLPENPRWPVEAELRIPPGLLAQVSDSKVGVRADERPALLAMLERAREAGNERLARVARASLPFATLMNDPAEHRGELALVEGELRRYLPIPAGENGQGLETLYEGWLFTDEAGRTNPYRIVCATRTRALGEGSEVRERVRIPAYFFKRMIYATAHGQHSAPMFVGDQLEVLPRNSPRGTDPGRNVSRFLAPATALLATVLVGLLYLTVGHLSRGFRRNTLSGRERPIEWAAEGTDAPPTPPTAMDPREFLRNLERDASGTGLPDDSPLPGNPSSR